jgi:hypothetical protein
MVFKLLEVKSIYRITNDKKLCLHESSPSSEEKAWEVPKYQRPF